VQSLEWFRITIFDTRSDNWKPRLEGVVVAWE